jgi:hypothetical protein
MKGKVKQEFSAGRPPAAQRSNKKPTPLLTRNRFAFSQYQAAMCLFL